jgi:PAS domain S-box-containing protein
MSDEKKNILLVEDELIIAHAEAQTLKDNGYTVIISPSASHAIETVKSGEEIDLILMDIDLGKGMDGTDAAEIILRERDIPVLFLSSHTEPEIVGKTEKITSYGYVVKNTGNTVLFASINMAFRLHEARVQTKLHEQMLRIALSERMRAEEELQQINKQLNSTIEKLETINNEMIRSRNELMERDKALGESEAIIGNLVNSLPLGIHRYRLEPDGRLIFEGSNPVAHKLLGVDNSRFIGMSIETAFPGLVDTEVPERYRRACSGGTPWDTEQIDYKDDTIKGAYEVHAFQTGPGRMAVLFSDITARKQMEKELSDTKAMLESAFEQTPIPMLLVSMPDHIVRLANSACGELLGVPEWKNYIGKSFSEIKQTWQTRDTRGNLVPLSESPIAKAMHGIASKNIEFSVLRKDGSVRWELASASPIRNSNGETIAAYLALPDITERKLAEKALLEKELLLRRITDNMIDAIFMADYFGKIQYASPSFKTILGHEPKNLLGRPVFDFVHQDDMNMILDAYREDIKQLQPRKIEFRFRRGDGNFLWVQSLANPLFSEEGLPIGAVISIRDITDHIRYAEALRESEERFRSLFEESPVAIIIIDSEGIATDINPAHEHLTGYPAKELIGLHFAEFPDNVKDDVPKYQNIFSEMMQGKKIHSLEIILRHRNGMFIETEFDISPLQTGKKSGNLQILIRDITDRKLAERALTKTIAEKETLLRELHHRVKNTFAIVTGIVGLEANRLKDPAMRDILKDIRNRIASLSNLYAILNHEHEVKDIRLDHYLDQMSRSLIESYASEKDRIALHAKLDEIHIDVNRAISIGLMVNELFTNALKYAFPGDRKGTIGIALKHEGKMLIIEVSDNGAGLPPDFSINKPQGLGHQLVRLLATQLNGTITTDSGGKTVFRISIPI